MIASPRSGPAPKSAAIAFLSKTDALVERNEIALGGGLPRLHLAHARKRLEPELLALAEQGDRLHAQRERVGRVVTERIEM